MKNIIKEFQEIFDVGEYTAKKYWGCYSEVFIANNYDSEDLVQEIKIVILESIQKFTTGDYKLIPYSMTKPLDNGKIYITKNDIFKLSNLAIGWRLKNILKDCKRKLTIETPIEKLIFEELNEQDEDKKDEKDEVLSIPVTLKEELIPQVRIKNYFNFGELRGVLTDKEYDVLFSIFNDGSTLREIGVKYSCSKQRIGAIYKKAMKKAKSYLYL